jgi:hypothetical protein
MAGLPGKTWGGAKPLVASKTHRSSGCNRNNVRHASRGLAPDHGTGARQQRSMKFSPCALSRLVTLRAVSHVRVQRLIETGELVDLCPHGREVALC